MSEKEESTAITGGCFCGAITYEFDAGKHTVGNCHCKMCRRTSGAAYVTWVLVPPEHFRWTKGTASILKSSEQGSRYFCSSCGTPMTCTTQEPPVHIDVTVGSLDDPEPFKPQLAVFTDTQLTWAHTEVPVYRA